MLGVGLLALVSLTLEYGFYLGDADQAWLQRLDLVLAGCFGLDLIASVFWTKPRAEAVRQRWFEWTLLVLFLVSLGLLRWVSPSGGFQQFLETLRIGSLTKLYLFLVQAYLLANLVLSFLRAQQRLLDFGIRPAGVLVLTFGLLILAGTLLLLLPKVSVAGKTPIGLLDAFFTATSAVCVTGLTVRDTGNDFSTLGQMILIALFQMGGLGIMTFVVLLSVFSRQSLSLPNLVALREMVSARAVVDVKRQIVSILVLTFFVEAAGVVLLRLFMPMPDAPFLQRWKWCVFHSISAFCNAGFGLAPDSLTVLRGNWGACLTLMGLIVLGGLGFPVLREVVAFRVSTLPAFREWRFFREWHAGRISSRLNAQAKLSLLTTLALVVVGALGFWMLETSHWLLATRPLEQVLAALFQSVTSRTAGFNTVPIDQLQDATLIWLMLLMVIGACPVSTGGGIKTVTFAVLILSVRSLLKGWDRVEAFGRRLPRRVVFAAISVFILYVMAATAVILALTITEPDVPLRDLAFESISALSTVGLSTGITAKLSVAGKLILCVAMFAGRVGPLSLVVIVLQSRARGMNYDYPEEEIVVG